MSRPVTVAIDGGDASLRDAIKPGSEPSRLRFAAPRVSVIATATAKETMSQPIFVLMTVVGAVALVTLMLIVVAAAVLENFRREAKAGVVRRSIWNLLTTIHPGFLLMILDDWLHGRRGRPG